MTLGARDLDGALVFVVDLAAVPVLGAAVLRALVAFFVVVRFASEDAAEGVDFDVVDLRVAMEPAHFGVLSLVFHRNLTMLPARINAGIDDFVKTRKLDAISGKGNIMKHLAFGLTLAALAGMASAGSIEDPVVMPAPEIVAETQASSSSAQLFVIMSALIVLSAAASH
ncbi:hypothetical protein ACS3SW_04775 [Roseobacteraceae bacterium S113]